MTFGLFKSAIEENLFESYKDTNQFKKTIKEFKHNILTNKSISKVFALYDELTTPQNLSEEDSKEFLNECLSLIQKNLKNIKLPTIQRKEIENKYKIIDDLVYESNFDVKERIKLKKQIVETLKGKKIDASESVKVPLKTMVKVANQTISNYLESLNISDKETLIEVLKEDQSFTEEKFNLLKEETLGKLSSLISNQEDEEIKSKIEETIDKVKSENYNQLSYLKLLSLSKSI